MIKNSLAETKRLLYVKEECFIAPYTRKEVAVVEGAEESPIGLYCIEGVKSAERQVEIVPQVVCCTRKVVCENTTGIAKIVSPQKPIALSYCIDQLANVEADEISEYADLDLYRDTPYFELLQRYKDIFSEDGYDIGKTSEVQHSVPLINEVPIKQRSYKCPEKLKSILKEQIQEMLENDIIRPSVSAWASPVLLVRKKNGTYRLCVDYRRLNSQTKKDGYPLPRINDLIEQFVGSKIFSSFDLVKGYYQVPIREVDKEKTAFVVEDGLYEYNVMPFGLTGAPNTFQD